MKKKKGGGSFILEAAFCQWFDDKNGSGDDEATSINKHLSFRESEKGMIDGIEK